MAEYVTTIVSIPDLETLNDEFEKILRKPMQEGVARTDAQISVLGHLFAGWWNQDQLPIPSEASAARGAWEVLQAAAERVKTYGFRIEGNHQPPESDRLDQTHDTKGRLSPMGVFDLGDDLIFGLYPLETVKARLEEYLEGHELARALEGQIVLLITDEVLDYDTWKERNFPD